LRIEATFQQQGTGCLALFGPSGSGKTTVLNAIAGLVQPQSGRMVLGETILFDSTSGINLPPEQRRIGYVFQDSRLFPHLTVSQNLDYGAGRRGGIAQTHKQEIVSLLGLETHLGRYPSNLSGGEKQRVGIGRALLSDPKLLLLDEPMASLDAARKQEIIPYLRALKAHSLVPLLLVSHDLQDVLQLADQVALMNNGTISRSGPIADIFASTADERLLFAVIHGKVHPSKMEILFEGGSLKTADQQLRSGSDVRLMIAARDIILSRNTVPDISVSNQLQGFIQHIERRDSNQSLVHVRVGTVMFPVLILSDSIQRLQLAEKQSVILLIKAMTIDRSAQL
jgi:molybdate transport system ATP-binding protein